MSFSVPNQFPNMCSEEDSYQTSLSTTSLCSRNENCNSFFVSKTKEVSLNKVRAVNDPVSPEAWSTNSDSPTPIVKSKENLWEREIVWQGTLGDEHRLLLATEEESSDRHSSDDDTSMDLESIYRINTEQLEYYKKQFYIIQPDDRGLVSGQAAKIFFEKSNIPIEELRHIWQLCDATKDGALSLSEFVAAMHLVVLRRNSMPLPHILPPCLDPNKIKKLEPVEGQTGYESCLLKFDEEKIYNRSEKEIKDEFESSFNKIKIDFNSSVDVLSNSVNVDEQDALKTSQVPSEDLLNLRCNRNIPEKWTNHNIKWTKFSESPTAISPSLKQKPAHFDLQKTAQAVVSDPLILHPVALRLSPIDTLQTEDIHPCNVPASISPSSSQIARSTGFHSLVYDNENSVLINRPENTSVFTPSKLYRHSRSNSLDLNKLKSNQIDPEGAKLDAWITTEYGHMLKKKNSQQVWNAMKLTDTPKTHTNPPSLSSSPRLSQHSSAFEVYRKPATNPYVNYSNTIAEMFRTSSNIQAENVDLIGCLKQRNSFLFGLCQNLSQELISIQQLKEEIRNNINLAI